METSANISDVHSIVGLYTTITIASFVALTFLATILQSLLNKSLIKKTSNQVFKEKDKHLKKKFNELEARICKSMVITLDQNNIFDAMTIWTIRQAYYEAKTENFKKANGTLQIALNLLTRVDDLKDLLKQSFSVIAEIFNILEELSKIAEIDQDLLTKLSTKLTETYNKSLQ